METAMKDKGKTTKKNPANNDAVLSILQQSIDCEHVSEPDFLWLTSSLSRKDLFN